MWISVGIHYAESRQIEFGSAAHRAFNQFQAMNMPFDGPVAPRTLKGGEQGSLVLTGLLCEVRLQAGFGVFFPMLPSDCIPLPKDANEIPCKRSAGTRAEVSQSGGDWGADLCVSPRSVPAFQGTVQNGQESCRAAYAGH